MPELYRLIYPSSAFFFLSQNLQRNHVKVFRICKIIDIQSISSQLYEIIIDYLLILAKVKPKQCPGAILTSK